MQRATGLFETTHTLYVNEQTFLDLYEKLQGKRPFVGKHNFNLQKLFESVYVRRPAV